MPDVFKQFIESDDDFGRRLNYSVGGRRSRPIVLVIAFAALGILLSLLLAGSLPSSPAANINGLLVTPEDICMRDGQAVVLGKTANRDSYQLLYLSRTGASVLLSFIRPSRQEGWKLDSRFEVPNAGVC